MFQTGTCSPMSVSFYDYWVLVAASTEESGHVRDRRQWKISYCIRIDGFCMAMDHAVDVREALEELPVDESLRISFACVGIHRLAAVDVVFDKILRTRHNGRGHVPAHNVHIFFLRMSHGDVTKRIYNLVIM